MSKNDKNNFNDKNKGKNPDPKGAPQKTTSTPPGFGNKPGAKPGPNSPRK